MKIMSVRDPPRKTNIFWGVCTDLELSQCSKVDRKTSKKYVQKHTQNRNETGYNLLWYFTLSYGMWDFLESICKLQDMYYTCKAHPCIPFWVLEIIEILHNHHWKGSAFSCEKTIHNDVNLRLHMKMLSSFNDCEEFLQIKMVYKYILCMWNTCLEAYKYFKKSHMT